MRMDNCWRTIATAVCLLIVYQLPAATPSGIEKTLTLSSGEEVSVEVFGKSKKLRILWIASTPGIKPRQRQVARQTGAKQYASLAGRPG